MNATKYTKPSALGYWLIVLLAILGVSFIQLPADTLLIEGIQNFLHIPAFALIGFAIAQLTATRFGKRWLVYVVSTTMALGFALLTESLQGLSGRPLSGYDLLRDFTGVLLGLTLYALYRKELGVIAAMLLLTVFLASDASRLIGLVNHYIARDSAFPVILDLEKEWANSFTNLRLAERSGGLVTFRPGKYPGIEVTEPMPDWSGYDRLKLSIVSQAEKPAYVILRIHDKGHDNETDDRFNRVIKLLPGENQLVIPLSEIEAAPAARKMNLKEISGIIFYIAKLDAPLSLQFSALSLQ